MHLESALRKFDVQRVVVAFGRVREADWVGIMRTAVLNDVEIHVVPRFFDIGMTSFGAGADQIWGIPLCRVRRSVLHGAAWRAKRVFDVVLAGLALLLAAPLLGLIAVAVRLSSPGPILFRQCRIGQDGRRFDLLKFRSMRTSHDGATSRVATADHQTAVGRWLRRTSLDELPQLWNVLRGDMSLVGPRPERPVFAERFSADIAGYRDRHRLPVGLTGWAQVHGLRGDDTSLVERARFDNLYIEGWSLWLDVVVLLRTVGAVLRMALSLPGRGCPERSWSPPVVTTTTPCPRLEEARSRHGRLATGRPIRSSSSPPTGPWSAMQATLGPTHPVVHSPEVPDAADWLTDGLGAVVLDVAREQRPSAYEEVRRHHAGRLILIVGADEPTDTLPPDGPRR